MKQLLTIAFMALLVSGCRKDVAFSESAIEECIKSVLQDSIEKDNLATIDFSRITQVKVHGDSVYYFLRSSKRAGTFYVLWFGDKDKIKRGVKVELEGIVIDKAAKAPVDGHISIQALNGALLLQSPIENGYIQALHKKQKKPTFGIEGRIARAPVNGDPYTTLAEVIVIGVRTSSDSYSYTPWISISTLFGTGSDYYAPLGSNVGTAGSSGVDHEDPILIDNETAVNHPAIDVNKYLDCFDQLPDAGAFCSVEIFTDLPVDTDPNKLVDWRVGSAGHTFLQLKKSVGGQMVVQNIGFYPSSSWKVTFTNAPVPGKFVDNGSHEFNASMVVNQTPEDFQRTLNEIRYLARSTSYDLDEFNCTDYALRVFNAARPQKIDIPLYQIPGGLTAAGTSTPQGLYVKLREMKRAGGADAANIVFPGSKGFVANSSGPCN